MQIIFTDQEKQWLNMKLFDWTIKENCPPEIRAELERKLALIRQHEQKLK